MLNGGSDVNPQRLHVVARESAHTRHTLNKESSNYTTGTCTLNSQYHRNNITIKLCIIIIIVIVSVVICSGHI